MRILIRDNGGKKVIQLRISWTAGSSSEKLILLYSRFSAIRVWYVGFLRTHERIKLCIWLTSLSSVFNTESVSHGSTLVFILNAIHATYFSDELSPSPSMGYPTNERIHPGNVFCVLIGGTDT